VALVPFAVLTAQSVV